MSDPNGPRSPRRSGVIDASVRVGGAATGLGGGGGGGGEGGGGAVVGGGGGGSVVGGGTGLTFTTTGWTFGTAYAVRANGWSTSVREPWPQTPMRASIVSPPMNGATGGQ